MDIDSGFRKHLLWCRRSQYCVGKTARREMAGGRWKISAAVAMFALLVILELNAVEAQTGSCSSNTCAANAYCYDYGSGSYRCYCQSGYYGNGYSNCKRRHISTWRIVVSIIGAVIGALLILCLCLACLCNLFRRRRAEAYPPQGDPAYGYPQQAYPQQAYPPQQGVPMYATNQKVPGPAGQV